MRQPPSSPRGAGFAALAAALTGCGPQPQTVVDDPIGCDDRELQPGEVRVKVVDCSEERVSGGEGASGDWVLDNARARFVVRFGTALTRTDTAGGTIIDAAQPGRRDGLREATPLFDTPDGPQGLWTATVTPFTEGNRAGVRVEGALIDGTPAAFSWTLPADSPTVTLEGADHLDLLLLVPSVVVGDLIEVDPDEDGTVEVLLTADGARTDHGGALTYAGATGLSVGPRGTVAAIAWPDGLAVSGDSDGDWIEALDADDGVLARLPVEGLRFTGWLPPDTVAVRPVAVGRRAGAPQPLDDDLVLPIGPLGLLDLQVTDTDGAPLPATLVWQGAEYPVPVGGGVAPLPPGRGPLVVTAGPAYEAVFIDQTLILGEPSLAVALDRVHPDDVALAAIGLPIAPQRDTRENGRAAVTHAVGHGAQLAVVTATDEVAVTVLPTELDRRVVSWGGSRWLGSDGAQVEAWPLTSSARLPAHGATPPHFGPLDALGSLARSGRRSAVNAAFVSSAGPVFGWPRVPTALRLEQPTDRDALFDLLGQGLSPTVIGPDTWLHGVPSLAPTSIEVERALTTGPTVAGNGPLITVAWTGPDYGRRRMVTVTCSGPTWMPLDRATLWSADGQALATFDAIRLRPPQIEGSIELVGEAQVVATCEGDAANPPLQPTPAWAVTSAQRLLRD